VKIKYPNVALEKICSIKGGKRLPKGEDLIDDVTEHPYIRARDIHDGEVNFTNPKYINDKVYEKIKRYIVNEGDVIITIVGANIGDSAYITTQFDKANLTENAVKLTPLTDTLDSKYLKYSLVPKYMKGYFQVVSAGAAQGKLGLYKIKKTEIPLPSIEIQLRIAAVLSAYDDLIENNLQRIKLLEEMAQITYEEWFMRMKFPGHEHTPIAPKTGLPDGWLKKPFSELGNFLNGYAFKPVDLGNKGSPIIKIKELKGGVIDSTPRNTGAGINTKYHVISGEIIFSWSGSLEVVLWLHEQGLLNQHLFKVTPKSNVPRSFLYLALKSSLPFFHNLTTGATMKHIKRKELSFVTIGSPSEHLINKFESIAEPMLKSIINLNHQNQFLKEARDILLPRLMTGMIDVETIELPDALLARMDSKASAA